MRLVWERGEFLPLLEAAKREARKYFAARAPAARRGGGAGHVGDGGGGSAHNRGDEFAGA